MPTDSRQPHGGTSKTFLLCSVILLGGAAGAAGQRSAVILTGGTPVMVEQTLAAPAGYSHRVSFAPNGDMVISYGGAGGVREVTVPGRPPTRQFTNANGEIGFLWGNAPVPPPAQAAPPVVPPPAGSPPVSLDVVVVPVPIAVPVLREQPGRLFTNANGEVGIFWNGSPATPSAVVARPGVLPSATNGLPPVTRPPPAAVNPLPPVTRPPPLTLPPPKPRA